MTQGTKKELACSENMKENFYGRHDWWCWFILNQKKSNFIFKKRKNKEKEILRLEHRGR